MTHGSDMDQRSIAKAERLVIISNAERALARAKDEMGSGKYPEAAARLRVAVEALIAEAKREI
jgi:HEPN domain-containing protein